jgi:hypothetical protein
VRGEAKITLLKAYCVSLPHDTASEHALFLHKFFLHFVFHSVCDGWKNQGTCLQQVLPESLVNPLPLEMLLEAFGQHSSSRTAVFEWHSHFKAGQVSVEDDECSGRPSTSKTTEDVEKFENSSTKTIAEQSTSSQTPLGSIVEFARRS